MIRAPATKQTASNYSSSAHRVSRNAMPINLIQSQMASAVNIRLQGIPAGRGNSAVENLLFVGPSRLLAAFAVHGRVHIVCGGVIRELCVPVHFAIGNWEALQSRLAVSCVSTLGVNQVATWTYQNERYVEFPCFLLCTRWSPDFLGKSFGAEACYFKREKSLSERKWAHLPSWFGPLVREFPQCRLNFVGETVPCWLDLNVAQNLRKKSIGQSVADVIVCP